MHPTNIGANDTNVQIAHATRKHDAFREEWQEWIATDIALKNQLVNAIDDLYLQTLRSRVTGYTSLTTLTMLRHLYNLYARLTPSEIASND